MSPEIAASLADHDARLDGCERADTRHEEANLRTDKKIDKLQWWIMGVLASSIGALIGVVVELVLHLATGGKKG